MWRANTRFLTITRIDCLTSIPLPAPTKLSREATNENEFLGLMMHVKRMQPHLRNQVCVNNYFILKLTSFNAYDDARKKCCEFEGLFQLWFDCWWCIRRVTHKLFSHRLPHEHTSPHSNKALERSNKWKRVLRFWWCMSRGCSRILEIKYVSMVILFRSIRILQCIWWRKKKCCGFNFWEVVSALFWLLMVFTTGDSQTVFA